MFDPVFRLEVGPTPQESAVVYLPTGEIVEGVKAFGVSINAQTGEAEATITLCRRWFEVVEKKPKEPDP